MRLTTDFKHRRTTAFENQRLYGQIECAIGGCLQGIVRRLVSHARTILVKLLTPTLGRSKTRPAGVNSVSAEQCGQVTRNVLLGSRSDMTEYPGAGFQK
jgi:hypothetical protein